MLSPKVNILITFAMLFLQFLESILFDWLLDLLDFILLDSSAVISREREAWHVHTRIVQLIVRLRRIHDSKNSNSNCITWVS